MRKLAQLILLAAALVVQAPAQSPADSSRSLLDYWPIGEVRQYDISAHGIPIGTCSGRFVGAVHHSLVGNSYLFTTDAKIYHLNRKLQTEIESELATGARGYPKFYQAEYNDEGRIRKLKGIQGPIAFQIHEGPDSLGSDTAISLIHDTWLIDRQCIPHWNLAFGGAKNLDDDTLMFAVLIPNLKRHTIMKMAKQPDQTLAVLGRDELCKVYYSLRTDEYYFVTPDRKVARVTLPKQDLVYNLASVKVEKPPAQDSLKPVRFDRK